MIRTTVHAPPAGLARISSPTATTSTTILSTRTRRPETG